MLSTTLFLWMSQAARRTSPAPETRQYLVENKTRRSSRRQYLVERDFVVLSTVSESHQYLGESISAMFWWSPTALLIVSYWSLGGRRALVGITV